LLMFRRNDLQARVVCTGILFYVLYVVAIGGDFMSGRFFAVPVFLAVAEAIRTNGKNTRPLADSFPGASAAAIILVVIHFFGFGGFVTSNISRNGIGDERRVYAPALLWQPYATAVRSKEFRGFAPHRSWGRPATR